VTPISFPDPRLASELREAFRVLTLPWLIQLKLAVKTYADAADVANLVESHGLDEAFLNELHPSVHERFLQCVEERRREAAWELIP
jgi:hypothetical protein